jgi:signal transduction histidine kinase
MDKFQVPPAEADVISCDCLGKYNFGAANLVRFVNHILMAGFFILSTVALAQEPKDILILHMENPRVPGNVLASKTIEQVMASRIKYQLFEEYLDENRLGTDYAGIADGLERKYANRKMDLIITVGPQALKFALQYGNRLWPSTPKVFCVVDGRQVPSPLPTDVTGIGGSYDFSPTIDLALRLQPDLRHVFYIGGASPQELGRRQIAERDLERFTGRIDIVYLNDLPWPQLLQRVSQLPDHSAILFTTYFVDPLGAGFLSPEACRSISAVSNAPVYGTLDTVLHCGIVGGRIYSVEAASRGAANLGLRILGGESISTIPVDQSLANQLVVDGRGLARWNIPEARVPSGAVVFDREPSLWEQNKGYVALTVIIFLVESSLIIFLLMQMWRRRRSDQAVRLLTRRVINASEEQRSHLARELHDDIGQRLSLISFQVGSFNAKLQANKSNGHYDLNEPLQELDSLITDVHELSHRLHSTKLEHLGLKFAMIELCRQISQKHNIKIDLQVDELPTTLPSDVSLCFYRVAQEALNNVIKHSGAESARIIFSEKDEQLRMDIADSGKGFDMSAASSGLGLTAMAERVRIVDGDFEMTSKPGIGTTIKTTIIIQKLSRASS